MKLTLQHNQHISVKLLIMGLTDGAILDMFIGFCFQSTFSYSINSQSVRARSQRDLPKRFLLKSI